jgi:hypothetical protein
MVILLSRLRTGGRLSTWLLFRWMTFDIWLRTVGWISMVNFKLMMICVQKPHLKCAPILTLFVHSVVIITLSFLFLRTSDYIYKNAGSILAKHSQPRIPPRTPPSSALDYQTDTALDWEARFHEKFPSGKGQHPSCQPGLETKEALQGLLGNDLLEQESSPCRESWRWWEMGLQSLRFASSATY